MKAEMNGLESKERIINKPKCYKIIIHLEEIHTSWENGRENKKVSDDEGTRLPSEIKKFITCRENFKLFVKFIKIFK